MVEAQAPIDPRRTAYCSVCRRCVVVMLKKAIPFDSNYPERGYTISGRGECGHDLSFVTSHANLQILRAGRSAA